jgi:hypothetical protein
VESFIRAAARKVQFHVIIVAEGMSLTGKQLRIFLSLLHDENVE